jgi:glutamate-1-semialdehyde aminotransferase
VPVPFGDVEALERAVDGAGSALAAIVLEPVVEREPPAGYLPRARALADRAGAVLVFDEVKTGFRLHAGGYQALCGVTPDVATFGKAMANGYPLAAVVGRAAVMDAARRAWVSSTLASEATALAAAHAVLDRHGREDVCAGLARTGAGLHAAVRNALAAIGAPGIQLHGLDPMWFLRFADHAGVSGEARETAFLTAARNSGVLFKRGAYNYAALAHDGEAIGGAVVWAAAMGFDAVRALDTVRAVSATNAAGA